MKILVDIGHPGHFHMFSNIMKRAIDQGYDVVVLLRDKDNAGLLLSQLPVKTYSIGGHKKGFAGKIVYAFYTIQQVIKIIKTEKPDVAIGESCFYFTPCTRLFRIPSIMVAMNDHTFIENALFSPFSTRILTSHSFTRKFGKKQIRFNGYLQWLYLMDFQAEDVRPALGLKPGDRYAIVRLVHWGAHHDIGHKGMTGDSIAKVIEHLSHEQRVFISSENPLPETLEKYSLKLPPARFQSALKHSSICVSEGATVAAEAAIMGVPTVYTNPLTPGYISGLEADGLLYHVPDGSDSAKVLDSIDKAMSSDDMNRAEAVRARFDNVLETLWSEIVRHGADHEAR